MFRIKNCILLSLLIVSNFTMAAHVRPNIILLLTDDQASWAVGYNNSDFLTPEIDKLAHQGIQFTRHYNTTSICMASRANIMTGKYEYKTGTNFMHGDMNPDIFSESYPVLLQNAGYYTGFVGKFGFHTPPKSVSDVPKGYEKLPIDRFDVWYGGKGQTSFNTSKNHYLKKFAATYPHSTLANGAAAMEFIDSAQLQGKPFMLSVSFKAPHAPVVPDKQFDQLFEQRTYKKPQNYWREKGQHLSLQAKLGRQYLTEDGFGFEPEQFNQRMAAYNQQIYAIDIVLGKLRKQLEQYEIVDNTVIIFASDNGYFNGNHGFSRKVLPYEESVKTPMIIFDPRLGQNQQTKIDFLTANTDIAPTILRLAGVVVPDSIDGKDMLNLRFPNSIPNHNFVPLINVWGSAPAQALSIVTKRWKYIYWFYGEGMSPSEELYDLSNDINEMHNVAHDMKHKPALEKLRALYDLQVEKWQTDALDNNGYQAYSVLLDRKIHWDNKRALMENQYQQAYYRLLTPYQGESDYFEKEYGLSMPNTKVTISQK